MTLIRKIAYNKDDYKEINGVVSYDDLWAGKKTFFPIDMYDKELSCALVYLKNYSCSYYIIKLPLLGQSNEFDTAKEWCARTGAAMVLNYLTLLKGSDPKECYVKHWKPQGKNIPEVLNPAGVLVAPGSAEDEYVKECEKLSGHAQLFVHKANRVKEAQIIAKDEEKIRACFSPILKSIDCNNPVIMYTGFSNNRSHIIVLCGYAEINGKLWICIADPEEDVTVRFKTGIHTLCELNNLHKIDESDGKYNVVRLIMGKFEKARASLRLVRASRFFDPHFKSPTERLYMDDTSNEGRKYGYYIYSHFKREVPPEIIESSRKNFVIAPFQSKDSLTNFLQSYFQNESGACGFYAAGLHQNIHGGIHISSEPPNQDGAVRASLAGYLVAVRFTTFNASDKAKSTGGDNDVARQFLGNRPMGFVLIRHMLQKKNEKAETDGEPFPLYSLYMHLDSPLWSSDNDFYKVNVPWFKKINDYQYGGVVDVNPSSPDFGVTKWAVQPVAASDASVTVADGSTVPLKKDDRTLGIAKPVPEDITEAVKAFKDGSVVTFSEPVLPVMTGEVIGYAKGSIHWEMFSPYGEQSGIQKLIGIDPDLKKFLSTTIEELKPDNFFDMKDADGNGTDEFKTVLLGALPEEDRSELNGVISKSTYADKFTAFYKKGSTFAKDGADDASTKDQFTYPVTIKLTNPYQFKTSQSVAIKVSFTAEEKNVGKTGTLSVTSFDKEYSIHVPAQADTMYLDCKEFFLEPIPLNELKNDSQKKSRESAFFGDITRFRWRGARIGHVSDWSVAGIEALLDKLNEKMRIDPYLELSEQYRKFLESKKLVKTGASKLDLFKTLIRFSTWWGRERNDNDPWGEVAVIGPGASGKSLFGGDAAVQLPLDAKIDNLHPVTCLWLLDMLYERCRIDVIDRWSPVTILGTDQTASSLYSAIISSVQPPVLGASLLAVLVDDGYENGIPVNFLAVLSGGQKILLGSVLTAFGTACWRGSSNVWGDWQLEVTRGDGSVIETTVKDGAIKIPKPEGVSDLHISAPGSKSKMHTGSLTINSNAPSVMEGFIFFKCCTVSGDATPDYDQPAIPAICIPVKLLAAKSSQKKTDTGLLTDGIYILPTKGATKVRIKKGGKFSYGDFESVYAGSKKEFQLNCTLYEKLALIRGNGADPQITVVSVADRGCSMVIKSSRANDADIKKIHENAKSQDGQDGFTVTIHEDKRVTLTVDTPTAAPVPMEFTFSVTSALSAIVNTLNPPPGSLVHTRPTLLIPNGGHAMLNDATGKDFEEVDPGDIKKKCGNDFLEAQSEFSFPPTGKLAAGEIKVILGDKINTSIILQGDIKEWEKVGPKIQIEYGTTKSQYGMIIKNTNILSEDWNLNIGRVNKRLAFSVVLTKPNAALVPPALPPVTYFDATPSIGSFTVEEADGKLILRGVGKCIPSSTLFEVKCRSSNGNTESGDVALKKTIHYSYEKGGFGRCNEQGNFEATLDRTAIKDMQKRKFVWRLAPGVTIAGISLPEQVCEYFPSNAG
jgi:Peptidase_C39 like family